MNKEDKRFVAESTVKALISFIPGIGGAIGSVLSDVLADRKEERFNEFLASLKTEIADNKARVNNEFVSKDDFLDILEISIRQVMNERSKLKREAYKNIIVNGTLRIDSNYNELERFLKIIDTVSEENIYFLMVAADPIAHNERIKNPASKLRDHKNTYMVNIFEVLIPDWTQNQIIENVLEVESIGLIRPISSLLNELVGKPGIAPIQDLLTSKGKRFLDFINLD